jgi:hypothetical protein
MLGRHGRAYAALGGLIALFLLSAAAPSGQQVHKTPDQQEATSDPAAARSKNPLPTNVGIPPGHLQASEHGNSAHENEETVELGSWPDWVIVGFTLVLTIVAILQHRLESRMAKDTGDSIQIAKQSADAALLAAQAAKRHADIAEDAAKRELRAYVGVVGGHVKSFSRDSPVDAHITLRNTGKTPARHVRLWHAAAYRSPDGEITEGERWESSGLIIASGGDHHLTVVWPSATREQQINVAHQGAAFEFFGEVRYQDVFGGEWKTQFRLEYTGRRDGAIRPCQSGNDAT